MKMMDTFITDFSSIIIVRLKCINAEHTYVDAVHLIGKKFPVHIFLSDIFILVGSPNDMALTVCIQE